MVYSVTIVGSSSSRFVFEYDYRNYFNISTYLAGVMPFVKDDYKYTENDDWILKNLDLNNWINHIIKEDVENKSLSRLQKKTDYLVMDFSTIIEGMVVYSGESCKNFRIPNAIYNKVSQCSTIDVYTCEDIWLKKSFIDFIKQITTHYSADQIVLI